MGPDELRVKWDWHYWNGSSWTLCAFATYTYNDEITNHMTVTYDFGSGSPWCGNGWYGTWADGWAKDHNNDWVGGPLWSRPQTLP